MSRRGVPPRHKVRPDVKYNSVVLGTFINKIMQCGKRSTAERIVYDSFALVEERMKREPMGVFEQALRNVSPVLEVKPRRVGGATYQVPVEVTAERGISLAIRWLIQASRNRPGRSMAAKLADELMDAAQNTGTAIKRREDTHRMAEANRAFAHYRW